MEMIFTLGPGTRVDGQVGPWLIPTDQPPDATAPSPFTLFLASIGACAAYYVQAFCRQRGLEIDGIRVIQHNVKGATGYVEQIRLDVELPPDFPDRYREAVIRAAAQCTVKKHLERPPRIDIQALEAAAL